MVLSTNISASLEESLSEMIPPLPEDIDSASNSEQDTETLDRPPSPLQNVGFHISRLQDGDSDYCNPKHQLKALYLEYLNDLPEYPSTNPEGYAYVVPVVDHLRKTIDYKIQSDQDIIIAPQPAKGLSFVNGLE
ncbi:hypothetical protein EYZ11_013202 [Aspergillus tanneri]|uniref:Uncharacterized protein n=1 Tax=Aspergillus tanneri TaxID=1220188 RepID=A0A4S3IY94_9EURO|nr:hypothetical protein EYZ11_013202 [Aspergillus tanneri]